MLGDFLDAIIGNLEAIQPEETRMSHTIVVYHSGYGHTRKQAEAVRQGAAGVSGATAELIEIDAEGQLAEGAWEKLDAADAIVFGTPTYMGGPSWQFKRFADASSKAWFTSKWKNKIAAGFTNSASMNGDKVQTLNYLFALSMQQGMIWVGTGMMPANSKAAQRNDVNWMGAFSGAMAQSPSDSSPEEGPAPGDLETARLFGARVAETAARWNR